MISIEYENGDKNLHITIGGDDFRDLVDFVKGEGCAWDPKMKCWTLPVALYKDFYDECRHYGERPEVDLLTTTELEKHNKGLQQLTQLPREWKPELMKFPPLNGIHPNENFQLDDIKRGLNQNRFLFHHEMGLGKSYILTALIEHKKFYKDVNKCLIFSTPIGTRNLKNELLKFGKNLREEDIIVFSSASDLKYDDRDVFNVKKYPQSVFIMTYDCLKSISNYYYDQAYKTKSNLHPSSGKSYRKNCMPIEEWKEGAPAGLFMDEVHVLGCPTSRRAQIFEFIVPFFEQRFEFTGTLADKYQKLYEPCTILDPLLTRGADYNTWLKMHNELGNRFSPFAVNDDKWDTDRLEKLNTIMMNFYCAKRKMRECLDLPLNYEVPTYYVDMSPKQREIYESFSNFTASMQNELSKTDDKSFTDRMISMFPYLHLAVDNPSCLEKSNHFVDFPIELQEKIKKFDYNKDSEKVKVVDDIIQDRTDENDEKGIIWYFHPQTKDALVERYKKYKPTVISADVPSDERMTLINDFLKDPKKKIIIASINVMNTSVTLIECKYEVYLESTYNFVVYTQSRGRIFRPGQQSITRTYSIRYDNSLDNLQELNLKQKGETLNSLFNQQYISAGIWKKLFSMSKDDRF